MGDQRFTAWYTTWPVTHVNAGETVEVVSRAEYDRLRRHSEHTAQDLGAEIECLRRENRELRNLAESMRRRVG